MTFGWHLPLTVEGVGVVPLTGYPRFDNRYVETDFDSRRYEVVDGEWSLLLDFETGERIAAPEAAATAQALVALAALAGLARRWRKVSRT